MKNLEIRTIIKEKDKEREEAVAEARREEKGSTREELESALNKIGWSIKGRYPNIFVYDHNSKRTTWRVMGDRLELSGASEHTSTCFHYKQSVVDILDGNNAVAFGTAECFTLFMNHDLVNCKVLTPPTH